ncbi:MAG: hypothetical protein CMP77_09600 [Flavobacterium sp.]|nr:hypothetical protein [Flavobacterium sp.]
MKSHDIIAIKQSKDIISFIYLVLNVSHLLKYKIFIAGLFIVVFKRQVYRLFIVAQYNYRKNYFYLRALLLKLLNYDELFNI